MAQFDVYKNPNTRTKKQFPYIVDVQNEVIAEIDTRIVIPLGKASLFDNEYMGRLTPGIDYEGEKLILLAPQITSVPVKLLKNPIGTIEHLRDEIINVLDFATTGI